MIPFYQYSQIGMPFHGLSVNGSLSTPLDGTKTINGAGYAVYPGVGACVLVRHPSAPGASRNTAQQALDTAHGYEWRDYALLCGVDRHINGGPALGQNAWIYIDTNGVPWRMTIEKSVAGSTATIEVWRRALFGRIGREYTITDELLASFAWSPQMPSWYSGGISAADIADDATVNDVVAMVPNSSGNSVILNVWAGSADAFDVFPETLFGPGVLLGIIEVGVAGAGDLGNTGVGISATITEAARFEDDLVTSRVVHSTIENTHNPVGHCDYDTYPPSEPSPAQADANTVIELPTSGYYTGGGGYADHFTPSKIDVESICYRTHRGDITRTELRIFTRRWYYSAPSGTVSSNQQWEAYWENPSGGTPYPRWRFIGCTAKTGRVTGTEQYIAYDEIKIQYSYAGFTEGVHMVKEDAGDVYEIGYATCGTGAGGLVCAASTSGVTTNLGGGYLTYTCNGQTYPDTFGNVEPVAGVAWKAPNLFGLYSDFRLPNGTDRRFTQRWIGDGESSVSALWVDVTTWLHADYTGWLPSPLHLRTSFNPVTMDFAHGLDNAVSNRFQYC